MPYKLVRKLSAENLFKMAKDSVSVNVIIETLDVVDTKVIHTHLKDFFVRTSLDKLKKNG